MKEGYDIHNYVAMADLKEEIHGNHNLKTLAWVIGVVKGIYLDLVAFEYRNKKQEHTHFLKQNFRKEMYDGMSKVEFNKQPTVGIARNFDDKKMQATNEYEPNDSELPF